MDWIDSLALEGKPLLLTYNSGSGVNFSEILLSSEAEGLRYSCNTHWEDNSYPDTSGRSYSSFIIPVSALEELVKRPSVTFEGDVNFSASEEYKWGSGKENEDGTVKEKITVERRVDGEYTKLFAKGDRSWYY